MHTYMRHMCKQTFAISLIFTFSKQLEFLYTGDIRTSVHQAMPVDRVEQLYSVAIAWKCEPLRAFLMNHVAMHVVGSTSLAGYVCAG